MSDTAANLRAQFPLLAAAPELHYLDSAATAQIHRAALDAVVSHETTRRANVMRGTYRLAEAADLAYERARQSAARFLNAGSAGEIVFTPGATASLNLVAHAFGSTLKAMTPLFFRIALDFTVRSEGHPIARKCQFPPARHSVLFLFEYFTKRSCDLGLHTFHWRGRGKQIRQ